MENKKYYVITNQDGKFVRRNDYDGTISIVEKYSDDCSFKSLNLAKRLAFVVNAMSETYFGNKYVFEIYENDTRIKKIDASIPADQRKNYGLEDTSAPDPDAGPTVTE